MTTWLARRILHALLVVFAMTVIVFLAINVIGDPLAMMVPAGASADEIARATRLLGLDRPLWYQYFAFFTGALNGDFGKSFVFNIPALQLILMRMPATLELAGSALFIALVLGIPLGLYVGLRPKAPLARAITAASILGFSLPTFWVGLMLILTFSVELGWLPTTGRGNTVSLFGIEWSFLTIDGLRHLALPAINLALFQLALVLRLTTAGVRETLPMDYIRFARAKGLSPRRVIGVHVLRNILIPIVTVVGLELGSTIAFAVVTESVFAWPGMGKLIIDSINALDRPVIVAYLVVIVVMFTTINLIVDVLYTILDPRVRLTAGRA